MNLCTEVHVYGFHEFHFMVVLKGGKKPPKSAGPLLDKNPLYNKSGDISVWT